MNWGELVFYLIYSFDKYGIVSGPISVRIIDAQNPVGIKEDYFPDIELFPNPANEEITFHTNASGPFRIAITTLNGQQILKREMQGTSYQIDLSPFQKGVYFITVRSKDFVTTRKIIKY